jgi:hypothetical protein
MGKKLISRCPFCSGELAIARLTCDACKTQIDTSIEVPSFFRLPEDLQHFVSVFLRCRGNIREAEKELGISYPTVCKRLDLVNELLGNRRAGLTREQILEQLEKGEITAKQAAELLKGGRTA